MAHSLTDKECCQKATAFFLIILICSLYFDAAAGQCILANPSFEIDGTGGPVFGGWNQFGYNGSTNSSVHGQKAALVSGPNNGTWAVSGFWQSQDCDPGEQWVATGFVQHPVGKPLSGQSIALVNIEWRSAQGDLIDYDSFTVANAATESDLYLPFSVTSAPAPAGTVETRVLLGVLQSPTDPQPDVFYDQVSFSSTSYPTNEDIQWNDFPGGRTLDFAGYTWRVKGPGYFGPGPNSFCDSNNCVWLDEQNRMHLTLQAIGNTWFSTEVVAEQALGYGDYIISTVGPLDQLDPFAVLGIFLWQYGSCWDPSYLWWNPYNEIDIEYSRWGDANNSGAQFVAQPYDWAGNISRFDAVFGPDEITSHAMRWLADRVEYRAWRGGPNDESASNMIHTWTYTGAHIPRPEIPRLHLNLWRFSENPASNQEVIFSDFNFIAQGSVSSVPYQQNQPMLMTPSGWLYPASPNPFNPQTTLRFGLAKDGMFNLKIYDVQGALVRSLKSGFGTSGDHTVSWNGLDDFGVSVASGVYLVTLQGHNFMESQQVVLIK